jgi:transcriptional regulator with XRE-family HTH domain
MYQVSSSQIRAARALLGWTQDDLAKATNLSRATIRNVELGYAVRPSNIGEVHKALAKSGVEFMDNEGVRRQPDERKELSGPDSCDRFFEDVMQTIKEKGGELICLIQSQDLLTKTCSTPRRTNLQRLEQVQQTTNVKCLITSKITPSFSMPSFQIRMHPEEPTIIPTSSFAFGDRYACAYQDSQMHFVFVVFHKTEFMHSCQNYFLSRWNIAAQLQIQKETPKRCA